MKCAAWFIKRDVWLDRGSFFSLLAFLLLPLPVLSWRVVSLARSPSSSGSYPSPSLLLFIDEFQAFCWMSLFGGILIVAANIQTEKADGSFRHLLVLPISREHLFWSRILSAVFWSAIPLTVGYGWLGLLRQLGFFGGDNLIALILGIKFYALFIALDLLLAVTFIGLSLVGSTRLILIATVAIVFLSSRVGTILFLSNPTMIESRKWLVLSHVVAFLSRMSNLITVIILLALGIGFVLSAIFKHKKQIVR